MGIVNSDCSCLQNVIIISYLKPYNCVEIICIRLQYLKPYNCVEIICIR